MLLIAALFLPPPAHGQSFDCRRAVTAVEHSICSDQALADLDVQLARAVKGSLASRPALKLPLLAGERRWIAARDRQCLGKSGSALKGCLIEAYRLRVADFNSGAAVKAAAREMVASCQTVVDRYRHVADSSQGYSPLGSLTPAMGIALAPELASLIHPATDLPAWASKQQPPVRVTQRLIKDVELEDGASLERLPNTNFYALHSVQGTAHCYSSTYFVVRSGVAVEANPPPGFGNVSCGTLRTFGTVSSQPFGTVSSPAMFEEAYDMTPSMTSRITVATWDAGAFAAACTINFTFAPRFGTESPNDWAQIDPEAMAKSCASDECEVLRKDAYELVTAVQKSPQDAARHYESLLSSAQKTMFESWNRSAGAYREYRNYLPADGTELIDSDPAFLSVEAPEELPYIYKDQLYVAHLGHFTIGWRVFGAWNVRFDQLQDGKLVSKGTFAIGMDKGQLKDASVAPVESDQMDAPN